MINLHLYGSLRRHSDQPDPTSESIVRVPWYPGATIATVAERVGISLDELGTNLFLNGRYVRLDTTVEDGDRVGIFPTDMQLLYKWYFDPEAKATGGNVPVEVRLYATLAAHAPTGRAGDPFDVDVGQPATLTALVRQLGLPEHAVHLAIVNGRVAHDRSIALTPGDRIGLFPPVGGG